MTTPEAFKSRFNELASETIDMRTQEVRKDLIGMSSWVLKVLLRHRQDLKTHTPRGERLDFWLKGTDQPVGAEGITPQPTMSFVVEGPPLADDATPRLKIHVPVPDGFRSDDLYHIENVPVPPVVYPERLVKHADWTEVLGRYAITSTECRIYPINQDSAERGPELWVPEPIESRVETDFPVLAQMVQDLVQWNLIPQSQVIVGQGSVTPL